MPPQDAEQAKWFAAEVQPHEPALRAWLQRRYPSLADVDDVLQDSYISLLRARDVAPIASAKSYLFGIARNAALLIFRKRAGREEVSVDEVSFEDLVDETSGVADIVNARLERLLALEAIEHLPTRCREIVLLRTIDNLSYREIADRLALSEPTVRVQMAKGLKRCAQYLYDRGILRKRP